MANFWIEEGETILFIGDSITDCGRRNAEMPLGNGYVRVFSELITARFPEINIAYINKGIGGNRVTDLRDRWTDDVVYHRPDRLSIKIGINDLHSHLRSVDEAVSPEVFLETYERILARTRDEIGCPVLLITPFYISIESTLDTLRGSVKSLLPKYIDIVEGLSVKYNTRLVNLQNVFETQLMHRDADFFCPEPVHPNRAGHIVIADALLTELSDK
ncbi:MAG: SGNH/GDSL hydrolase family protein [Candidatus Latescibacterota bacterium]|nr:SGNH/GDSL hydrolase family protein [Candidatus Latescibacterota bacterium]